MIAFLFGLFIFLFIGVGALKLFGAKNLGRILISWIASIAIGIMAIILLFKFMIVACPEGVGALMLLGIIIFVIVAIFLIIRIISKVFGGKSVAKFMLLALGIIAFIAIMIGGGIYGERYITLK